MSMRILQPFIRRRAPFLHRHYVVASLLTAVVGRSTSAFVATPLLASRQQQPWSRHFSSSSSTEYQNIGFPEMVEIVDDLMEDEDADDTYCVIDVRTIPEVQATGLFGKGVHVIPVQEIMEYNVFAMEDTEFSERYGFEKPLPDQTIVFTCAAGIRSVYACRAAAAAGYTKLINYTGGANEWFTKQ